MRFGAVKNLLAGAVFAALAAAPALADPAVWVSNVQVPSGLYGVNTTFGSIYYSGLIDMTVNPGTQYNAQTAVTIPVWCDDFFNNIYIGSQDQFYQSNANNYLSPLANWQIHDIAGLAFLGDQNQTNATFDAEIQLAIWEIEYSGLKVTGDAALQSAIHALIAGAHADYNAMALAGYGYAELESPGCNQTPGQINYLNSCQTQGQIYIVPPGNGCCSLPVPEPGTLGLLGSGLVALGAAWRRRKSAGRALS